MSTVDEEEASAEETIEADAGPSSGEADTAENTPDRKKAARKTEGEKSSGAKGDAEWLGSSAVKNQMLRIDPTFQEPALDHTTFTDFVTSRGDLVELQEDGRLRKLRLRPTPTDISGPADITGPAD